MGVAKPVSRNKTAFNINAEEKVDVSCDVSEKSRNHGALMHFLEGADTQIDVQLSFTTPIRQNAERRGKCPKNGGKER